MYNVSTLDLMSFQQKHLHNTTTCKPTMISATPKNTNNLQIERGIRKEPRDQALVAGLQN